MNRILPQNQSKILDFRAVPPRFRPQITRSPLIGARAWREAAGLATFSDIYRANRHKFVADVPFIAFGGAE